jgi:uncharacterized protein YkwD
LRLRARHPSAIAALLAIALSTGTAASVAGAAAPCPGADVLPRAAGDATAAAATLCLVDAQRTAHGLAPLRPAAALGAAARDYAGEMVAERFFSHVAPDGQTLEDRVAPTGYSTGATDIFLGENLGWGAGSAATPHAIVDTWMASAPHRANLLEPEFKDVGIVVVEGAPVAVGTSAPAATYVAEFGMRHVPIRRHRRRARLSRRTAANLSRNH